MRDDELRDFSDAPLNPENNAQHRYMWYNLRKREDRNDVRLRILTIYATWMGAAAAAIGAIVTLTSYLGHK
jgi:hypothetical protein